jgi:hypothetical protein
MILELNKFNKKFQVKLVDLTSIGSSLDVYLFILCRLFLSAFSPSFGWFSKCQGFFFQKSIVNLKLVYVKKDGVKIAHQLHDGLICEKPSSLQDYKIMGGKYVQKVTDTLND